MSLASVTMSSKIIPSGMYSWALGLASRSLDSALGSHLGLKKFRDITQRRTKKRPEDLKQWCQDLNLERPEYH